jgi:hypothetical protein
VGCREGSAIDAYSRGLDFSLEDSRRESNRARVPPSDPQRFAFRSPLKIRASILRLLLATLKTRLSSPTFARARAPASPSRTPIAQAGETAWCRSVDPEIDPGGTAATYDLLTTPWYHRHGGPRSPCLRAVRWDAFTLFVELGQVSDRIDHSQIVPTDRIARRTITGVTR